jgi:hypothetical protein
MAKLPVTTSISRWQRATKHVESGVRSGEYVNAETALIFCGPPFLSDLGGIQNNITPVRDTREVISGDSFGASGAADAFYPLGMVEAFSVQQMQNVQKMYEIGSRQSYQAAGRVLVAGSIGRVVFNGPSLMRALYAYYPGDIALANGKTLNGGFEDSVSHAKTNDGFDKSSFPTIFNEPGAAGGTKGSGGTRDTFFINLMSELFSHPFGIGVMLRDNANRNVVAWYCEDSMITSQSINISASSTLITEGANFQCNQLVPMEFSTEAAQLFQILGL